jgi:RNA polymerase sigma-70 factor (ECF subfamily)
MEWDILDSSIFNYMAVENFSTAFKTQSQCSMISDSDIINQVLTGDRNAFSSLVERYSAYAAAIAQKYVPHSDVEEVVQEAYLIAFRCLGSLRSGCAFKSWFAKIVVRSSYDYWRKGFRKYECTDSSIFEQYTEWVDKNLFSSEQKDIVELAQTNEAKALLEKAMSGLSAEDRMVIGLVHFEELSCAEAADILGWSTVNVKVRAFRARRKLRTILSRWLDENQK